MAKQIQLRRGTTAETNAFTGAVGEVTVDTDKKILVVHDGTTVGGFPSPTLESGKIPNSQLPVATEAVTGIVEIATQSEAITATDDTKVITPLKLKNTLDAKTGFAQINADGTIGRSKGVIQSCSKTSTGLYTINILNPLNKNLFALTSSNGVNFAAVASYFSNTSLQVATQNTFNSSFADTAFTIMVELQ